MYVYSHQTNKSATDSLRNVSSGYLDWYRWCEEANLRVEIFWIFGLRSVCFSESGIYNLWSFIHNYLYHNKCVMTIVIKLSLSTTHLTFFFSVLWNKKIKNKQILSFYYPSVSWNSELYKIVQVYQHQPIRVWQVCKNIIPRKFLFR